ncbi:MAG: dephospho-CoA kinase, partial [Gammaproteobacteria bacterium]|nr:dephospho-CoA kinase [Gammaproteobacteria bacterium]
TLNRAALRTHIFQNPIAKAQLEALLHPLIQAETLAKIDKLTQTSIADEPLPKFIIVAIPLLTEGLIRTGQKPNYIDQIWVVDAPEAQQLAQACQRDNASSAEIQRIIEQQASRTQRLAIADKVILNTQDTAYLEQQVNDLLHAPLT